MTFITSKFPNTSAYEVWSTIQKTKTLFEITKGWVSFGDTQDWPKEWYEGLIINTSIHPFGSLKGIPYTIMVQEMNPQKGIIRTVESSPGIIKEWHHTMHVGVHNGIVQYTDAVSVEARKMQWLVKLYILLYYRSRHRRLRKLLR